MNIAIPFAAVTQQPVPSAGFNNNFTEVATKFNTYAVQTDIAKVIAASHTFNAAQTWSVAQTFPGITLTGDLALTDGLYDIGKVAASRPRDGFFTRNVTVGAVLTLNGALSLTTAASQIVPGVTSLSLRNNANTLDNVLITDAGIVTLRGGLVVAAGGASIVGDVLFTDALYDIGKSGATRPRDLFTSRDVSVGGVLRFATAAAKIIPGATSLTWRNNADSQNNLQILNNGDVLFGTGNVTISQGGLTFTSVVGTISIGGAQVIAATKLGYTNPWTGTLNRATAYDASTVTLVQLAQRVAALQADFTAHGLIGP